MEGRLRLKFEEVGIVLEAGFSQQNMPRVTVAAQNTGGRTQINIPR